jgi:hypothetical protein
VIDYQPSQFAGVRSMDRDLMPLDPSTYACASFICLNEQILVDLRRMLARAGVTPQTVSTRFGDRILRKP